MAAILRQVVSELAAAHREIEADFEGAGSLRCDPSRLGQMLSNLLANALTHRSSDGPIRVGGKMVDGVLALSVSNPGKPIPPEVAANLFEPCVRNAVKPSAQG